MSWNRVSKGIFFPEKVGDIIITDTDIANLIIKEEKGKSRYCAHKYITDNIHEMMIYHKKDTVILPHQTCNESYLILEGELDLLIYDELNDPIKLVEMGSYGKNKVVYYRLDPPRYRAVRLVCDTLFFEVKQGPLRKESTIWADWGTTHELKNQVIKSCELLKKTTNV